MDRRYKADITAGALKLPESRVIAELLLRKIDKIEWQEFIQKQNLLKAKNPATAIRLTHLIRGRLELMDENLWLMIRDGDSITATQAVLAAAVKHSALLGDFMDLVLREQYKIFSPALSNQLWEDYLINCRGRDAEMPLWNDPTRQRLRSSVYQTLAQAGYIEDTKTLRLQHVFIAPQVIQYLNERRELYVLRCLQVSQ